MVESAEGRLGRLIAVRLSPGEDLILGIEEACNRHNIRHGVIISGIGSLRSAIFCDPAELEPGKFGYGEPIVHEGPIELISTSGSIGEGSSGEVLLHVHCNFSDGTGDSFAGHLVEGNIVLITADLVIAEFDGIYMDRYLDEELGVYLMHPTEK